jgi:hypothetical protein
LIQKLIRFGELAAITASALLLGSSMANAQIEGALQYPPASVGEDAQPPPPARMAPLGVLPPRIEMGISGSSRSPAAIAFAFSRARTEYFRSPHPRHRQPQAGTSERS